MEKEFLTGLIAAPFTAMNPDGSIALETISLYSDLLVNQGVSGAFVCGTTGEGTSLSMNEKKAVINEWVRCSDGRLKIIAHVGGLCQSECIELAQNSVQSGVDAIAAMAPFFFKPKTSEDLLHFLEPIAAAAKGLPFYYYHIPSMTGVELPVHTILKDAKKIIPNFAGVKFTHSDMMDLQQSLSLNNGRYEILFGSDEILICGLSLGVQSAVGSTYNYMTSVYLDLMEDFRNQNLLKAAEKQQFTVQVVQLLQKYGGPIRAGKAIMEFLGVNCGPCRLPLRAMSESEVTSLKKDLSDLDFFEKINLQVFSSQ